MVKKKKNIKGKKVSRKVTKVEDIKNISPLPPVPEKKTKSEPKTEVDDSLDDIWDNDNFEEEESEELYDEDGVKKEEKSNQKKFEPRWTQSQLETIMQMCEWYANVLVEKPTYKKLKDPLEDKYENAKNKLMFAAFMAMPETGSIPMSAFWEKVWVSANTLTKWRAHDLIMKARDEIMYFHFKKHTPKVIKSLFDGTQSNNWKTGEKNVQAIKLFMQIVEKWSEKTETDIKSDGKRIALMLWSSQFVKPGKVKEEEPSDDK